MLTRGLAICHSPFGICLGNSPLAGFAVWRVHGFRLGRAPLPQEDRPDDHGRQREELAVPGLKRLEPEALRDRGTEEMNLWLSVRRLLAVVRDQAARGVHAERHQEEEHERETEGVFVQP